MASKEVTNTKILAFIAVLVFKLLSYKTLFINRKVGYFFQKIANFMGKLWQKCK